MRSHRLAAVLLTFAPTFAACSGGGGATIYVASASAAPSSGESSGESTVGIPLSPANSIQIGGKRGTTAIAHKSNDLWEYTEDPLVLYPGAVSASTLHVTVSPSPPAGVTVVSPVQIDVPSNASTNSLELRWTKVPGTAYTVSVVDTSGTNAAETFVVRSQTSVPNASEPSVSKKNDPYYYGSLEHSDVYPFGIKLPNSGAIDPRALSALVNQGVHFIRFGPTPDEVAFNATGQQSEQSFSFASTDPAIDTLHQNGITALYVIDAAPAPPWGNRNAVGDVRPLFETPNLYAKYCGGVASHIASNLPWITRVEIGSNEPNYPANWQNNQAIADGMPAFADTTGYGFALYAKACYAAIKAVDSKLQVVAPGIDVGADSYSFLKFVDHMYSNGCRTGVCWDIMSLHNFSWLDPKPAYDQSFIDNLYGVGDGPGSFYSYRSMQIEAVLNGDSIPNVMITETGFSSSSQSTLGVAQPVQALYLSEAFTQYLSDPTIVGIVYADIVDHTGTDDLFGAMSTLDESGNPKPDWYVYHSFATY